jgi:hypothetical protein
VKDISAGCQDEQASGLCSPTASTLQRFNDSTLQRLHSNGQAFNHAATSAR